MAESSQQEQVPQQDQPNKPGSPIPFEPATQVLFDIDKIIFNNNNEVALLYPPHTNSDYFKVVLDFIYKYCLREAFTRTPNQYKENLSEFWYTAKGLRNSKVWFSTPTGDEPVAFKAPRTSSKAKKKVTQGTKPGANSRQRKKQIPVLYNHPQSKIEAAKGVSSSERDTRSRDGNRLADTDPGKRIWIRMLFPSLTGSQTGHSVKETQSSSTKDTNPSQPPSSKPVVAGMHKEVEQATGGPTSLGVTTSTILQSKSASGHDASATSIAESDPGKTNPNDSVSLLQDPTATEDASASQPPSPKSVKIQELSTQLLLLQTLNSKQLTELLVKSVKPELSKLLTSHDFNNLLRTELKELPSKFIDLTRVIKELNKYVHKLKVELSGDLNEIPSKLEKAKVNTLDALSSLVQKVTEALNMFSQVLKLASKKTKDHGVPSKGQAGTHPAEGEKNTQHVTISLLFQRRIAKDAERANLNKQPTTTVIPPTIPTTSQFQSPFFPSPLKGSLQPEGELIKKDKGKKAMSSKDAEEEDTRSDSDEDANLTGSMVESSKKKKLKKLYFVIEGGDHIHLTTKQIKEEKRIEESVKSNLAKQEIELG
ncbi:hypothetical protein Tco_0797634 [Tanacetum coccineum]